MVKIAIKNKDLVSDGVWGHTPGRKDEVPGA